MVARLRKLELEFELELKWAPVPSPLSWDEFRILAVVVPLDKLGLSKA